MPTVTQSRITLSSDGLGSKGATGKASDSILTVILVPESGWYKGEESLSSKLLGAFTQLPNRHFRAVSFPLSLCFIAIGHPG